MQALITNLTIFQIFRPDQIAIGDSAACGFDDAGAAAVVGRTGVQHPKSILLPANRYMGVTEQNGLNLGGSRIRQQLAKGHFHAVTVAVGHIYAHTVNRNQLDFRVRNISTVGITVSGYLVNGDVGKMSLPAPVLAGFQRSNSIETDIQFSFQHDKSFSPF